MASATKPMPIPDTHRRVTPALVVHGGVRALGRGRAKASTITDVLVTDHLADFLGHAARQPVSV
jgi:hypothetical protein